MRSQLLVKIDDVTVRVPFAQYRYKPENKRLHAKSLTKRFDEALGRYLRGAVKRGLYRDWGPLRRWKASRLAVDRPCRGECDVAHTIGAHRLEYIYCGDRVLFEVLARM